MKPILLIALFLLGRISSVSGQADSLGVTAFSIAQLCETWPDGQATAIAYGGLPPYTYLWNTGDTVAGLVHLTAGNYSVTVTDSQGDTAESATQVLFFNQGIFLDGQVTDISCHGLSDGAAAVTPFSGTAPYTYLWTTGAGTPEITGLGAGTYVVSVVDVNGCSNAHSVEIEEPAALTLSGTVQPQTGGQDNGSIQVEPAGGSPPYTYAWEGFPAVTGPVLANLAAGLYQVTVTDAHGCTLADEFEVPFQSVGTFGTAALPLRLFPNPAPTGRFLLQLPGTAAGTLYIVSTDGHNRRSLPIPAGCSALNVDLEELPPGVYLVRAERAGQAPGWGWVVRS